MNKLGTAAMVAICICNSEYDSDLYLYNGVIYSFIYDSNYGSLWFWV